MPLLAEKDGCHEFIDDSAEAQQEWILKMQSRGMCACDEEHMFKCPDTAVDNSDDYSSEQDELDEVSDNSDDYSSEQDELDEVSDNSDDYSSEQDELDEVSDNSDDYSSEQDELDEVSDNTVTTTAANRTSWMR